MLYFMKCCVWEKLCFLWCCRILTFRTSVHTNNQQRIQWEPSRRPLTMLQWLLFISFYVFSTNGRKKKKNTTMPASRTSTCITASCRGKKWVRASADSIEGSCFHHYQLELKLINPWLLQSRLTREWMPITTERQKPDVPGCFSVQ